ncbi:MAG: hypothetical protein H6Q64_918 [Firmicutes bacterium]|nr:hypothetical protein [Bacillota bacterium]
MNIKFKYIGTIVLSTALCLTLHLLTPPVLASDTSANTLSKLVLLIGLPLTALLWAIIGYSCVAFVFYLIEDRIPGNKSVRGLKYGISIGLLWLLGYIMGVPKSGNPFINEFVGGLCDAIPVVLMGWLLGRSSKEADSINTYNTFYRYQSFIGIVVFVLVFSLIRIVSYYTNIIDTGFRTDPVYTLVWTIVTGLCLGLTYLLLRKTTPSSSSLLSSIKFGFILFGLTWGGFFIFIPLVLKGQMINTIFMFLIDTISVTIAYYLSEIVSLPRTVEQSSQGYNIC